MSDNSELFLKEKPVKAIVLIRETAGETFCSEISKTIDSTYAHTVKIISKMENLELLTTRKEGRKKMLNLTDKGQEQAEFLSGLLSIYRESPKDSQSNKKLRENSISSE